MPEALPEPWYILDIRCVGMTPREGSLSEGPASLWAAPSKAGSDKQPPAYEWTSTKRADGRYFVQRTDQGLTTEWLINPDEGWNAERIVQRLTGGEKVIEVVNALKLYDGKVWFPQSTVYLVEGKPRVAYTIHDAKFNGDSDAGRFTPTDIGVEPSYNVVRLGEKELGPVPVRSGERIIPAEDYGRLEREGKLKVGPNVRRYRDGRAADSPYVTEDKRRAYYQRHAQQQRIAARRWWDPLWAQYVHNFCTENAFSDQQTAAARGILHDCQNRAMAVISGREAELDALEERYWQAAREKDRAALNKVTAERLAVRRPIERIFESELKPRLEALLTAEQKQARTAREAAGKSRASDAGSREAQARRPSSQPEVPGRK